MDYKDIDYRFNRFKETLGELKVQVEKLEKRCATIDSNGETHQDVINVNHPKLFINGEFQHDGHLIIVDVIQRLIDKGFSAINDALKMDYCGYIENISHALPVKECPDYYKREDVGNDGLTRTNTLPGNFALFANVPSRNTGDWLVSLEILEVCLSRRSPDNFTVFIRDGYRLTITIYQLKYVIGIFETIEASRRDVYNYIKEVSIDYAPAQRLIIVLDYFCRLAMESLEQYVYLAELEVDAWLGD